MYVERPPAPALTDHVARVWRRTVSRDGVGRPVDILPDACLDIVWHGDGRLDVAGPDTRPAPYVPASGADVVGVRFRSGVAPSFLGVPSHELRDRRVELEDLWGPAEVRELAERLAAAPGWDAARVLEAALVERLPRARPIDPVAAELVRRLGRPGARLARLGPELGLGERQLRRRCETAVGYGPKTLDRILRFRRFQELAARGGALADLALAAGYVDQAHLAHECRRLAGRTPGELVIGARVA